MLQFRDGKYTAKEVAVMVDAVAEAVNWLKHTNHDNGLAYYDLCRLQEYLEHKHADLIEREGASDEF